MAVILVIDDEAQIRALWSEVLKEEGHVIRVAASGAEGLKIVRREPIDVVITDVLMPGKDGIETLIEMKALSPRTRFVVASGGGAIGETSFLETAEKFGADATLSKPVDLQELLDSVTRLASAA